MRRYVLIFVCMGILLGSIFPFLFSASHSTILFVCVLITSSAFCIFIEKKEATVFLFLFCISIGSAIGLVRGIEVQANNTSKLGEYLDKKVTVIGTVAEYPDVRTSYTFLTLKNIQIQKQQFDSEFILVRAPLYPQYAYGDVIEVSGSISQPPKSFGTSTSRFSYKDYLSSFNIYATISYPSIRLVSSTTPSFISSLYLFKDRCIEIVRTYISQPAGGLLIGILFGIKHALSNSVLSDFTVAGLIHIVVLSGYNIAVIVAAVSLTVRMFPAYVRIGLIYGSIVLFILFVGASPTVVRAGIMAMIALYGRQSGKELSGVLLLSIAAACMTLYEPRTLLYDPSFQLSFLATLSLLLWTPITSKWCKAVTEKYALREVISSTIAAQIMVVPYILWYIGTVSTLGVLTNILVVPLVPLVMLLGFIILITGLIYTPLSMPFAYIAYGVLACILFIVDVFSAIPFASLTYELPTFLLLLVYIVQLYYLLKKKNL
jgi:competence protein ComEC